MSRLAPITDTAPPFAEWFKEHLRAAGFYVPRFDRYLMADFARTILERCDTPGQSDVNLNVKIGRYLNNSIMPDPKSCVEIAAGLACHPVEVLIAAGYVTRELVMDYARQQQEQQMCGQEPQP